YTIKSLTTRYEEDVQRAYFKWNGAYKTYLDKSTLSLNDLPNDVWAEYVVYRSFKHITKCAVRISNYSDSMVRKLAKLEKFKHITFILKDGTLLNKVKDHVSKVKYRNEEVVHKVLTMA